jgi:hypothetical protein
MQNEIPAQTEIICDCCKVVCDNQNRLHSAVLTLKRDAVDMHNIPCADASLSLDLCDKCAKSISNAVNEACSRLREKGV